MIRYTVDQIWRYPVKSMAGEQLDAGELTGDGIAGDRAWALRDEERGCIADARKLPAMLNIRARYPGLDGDDVELMLPSGERLHSGKPDVHAALSRHLGAEVTLWPRLPAAESDHYRRALPPDLAAYLQDLFGVDDLADLPDLSALRQHIVEFQTLPGTYFDVSPLHLVSAGSLAAVAAASGSDADVRRFRPNLVIAGDAGESGWIGRYLRIGSAELFVEAACPRCVMITQPQGELPADRGVLRSVHQRFGHTVGVYATVVRPGAVGVGDQVWLP